MDSGQMHVGTADVLFSEEYPALATAPPIGEWLKFRRLVDEWQEQRGVMSSITEAILCPAYQTIIGMGELAVPFILVQLESEGDNPDQWLWALKAITGADPVDAGDRGNYTNMTRAWLRLGQQPRLCHVAGLNTNSRI